MKVGGGLTKQRRALTKFWLQWRLPIIAIVGVVVLAVGGWFGYQNFAAGSAESERAAQEAAVRDYAAAVSAVMGKERQAVATAISAADLASLLEAGDPQVITAGEQSLLAGISGAQGLRILSADVNETDYESKPPISYAALDLLRRGRENEKVPLEVHLFGGENAHVAAVSPVKDPGGTLRGQVLVGLDLALIKKAMAKISVPSGYLELQQPVVKGRPLKLGVAGNQAAKQGGYTYRAKVAGTTWSVFFWSSASGQQEASALPVDPVIAGGVGAGVLLLAAVIIVVMRKRGGAAGGKQQIFGGAIAKVMNKGADTDSPEELVHAFDAEPEAEVAAAPKEPLDAMPPVIKVDDGDAAGAGETGEHALPESIFRAYDIRGVVGETLTTANVERIGRAIGSEAIDRGQQTIIVACDGRTSGPDLVEALVTGIRASGRDVIDVGRVPTPVLYFATHFLNTGSGVMVTGSHNPPQYNGLKIMLGGETLFGNAIMSLRERIEKGDLADGEGTVQSMEVVDDYVRRITEDIPVALGGSLKIVVDCGNGIAGAVAPKVLKALGHDVVELYCDVDGSFPNHHPDPSQPDNLQDLIRTVQAEGADLGYAFDGDGDRLGVVDGKGNILWPDRQMMLYARDVISRNAGATIVFDVKCTSRLPKVIEKLGGKPLMWKTGHSFIKNKMKETGALLAGEMSGHIFFKERWFGFDDAIYAAARLTEILVGLKQPPADIFAKLPTGVSTPELRLDLEEGKHMAFMERLLAEAQFADGKPTTIDGLRVDFADGWGLVRASNTTPCLVLRFEGDNAEALNRIQEGFRGVLLGLDPDLNLPF
ncbi:MAG: phosphomannomutase/phosphoglucomutase [Gammaproteobacteria bacterium]|nr:MAG: phosphomannomutase/phosphoglucomutase [Gammaproteobacteria bacterium]